ncbi:hypothetical protein [Teredinibacter turnerae]|uniref:hypothetical protein n=1 Tax=Teredinibacter turnerae TaxID=2426 RepID=UPI0003784FF4|nr:hypothetical protein [Teredinibacter turnerae]
MKKYIFGLSLAFLTIDATAYFEQEFSIGAVGGSSNTNSVFIDVVETAQNTNCSNKNHFKLAYDSPHADRFYSTALAAQAQGKKMRLGYEPDDCLSNGVKPRVFKIIN